MPTLHEIMKDVETMEFPSQLHQRIMRTVYLRKIMMSVRIVGVVIAVNLAVSLWLIWNRVLDADGFTELSIIWSSFELNMDFIKNAFTIIGDVMPRGLSIMFGLNALIAVSLMYFSHSIKRAFSNFKVN